MHPLPLALHLTSPGSLERNYIDEMSDAQQKKVSSEDIIGQKVRDSIATPVFFLPKRRRGAIA